MDQMDNIIGSTSMTPENAEVYFFAGVIAYFFPGATKTKPDGSDRFKTDMMNARKIWGRGIRLVGISSIDLSQQEATDINLQQSDLDCDKPFFPPDGNRPHEKMAMRRHRDYVDYDLFGNWISVWYVPFATFSDGNTVGCASSQVGNPVYHYIVLAEDSNTSDNQSVLAHEIGHILFGTVPGQDKSDPTGPSTTVLIQTDDGTFTITPNHSLKEDNVMYPNAGNNSRIESSQREKAEKSRILTAITPPSVWDE